MQHVRSILHAIRLIAFFLLLLHTAISISKLNKNVRICVKSTGDGRHFIGKTRNVAKMCASKDANDFYCNTLFFVAEKK